MKLKSNEGFIYNKLLTVITSLEGVLIDTTNISKPNWKNVYNSTKFSYFITLIYWQMALTCMALTWP